MLVHYLLLLCRIFYLNMKIESKLFTKTAQKRRSRNRVDAALKACDKIGVKHWMACSLKHRVQHNVDYGFYWDWIKEFDAKINQTFRYISTLVYQCIDPNFSLSLNLIVWFQPEIQRLHDGTFTYTVMCPHFIMYVIQWQW